MGEAFAPADAVEALAVARQEGLCRFIGITVGASSRSTQWFTLGS